MISVKEITDACDIKALVDDINTSQWDKHNDMAFYKEKALRMYLQCQGTVFIACQESSAGHPVLMGFASARIEMKPYDEERWLFVDEVDVCVDQRRKGAGRAMMAWLLEFADRNECEEVWLGTETDNEPAKALYQSLGPDEVEGFIGFAYEIDG